MVKLTYNGHACFEISDGKNNIIIDPYLDGNPKAQKKPEDIKADIVYVSHAHGDHFGQADIICKNNSKCTFVSTAELVRYATTIKGIEKAHPMHIGGSFDFGFCKIKLTNALHGSSDENNNTIGPATGAIFTIAGKNIYYAGDTGLFGDMELIGDRNNIDIAILPIGDNYTMGIDDAAYATELLNCSIAIPMHYGTFSFIDVDPNDFIDKLPPSIQGVIINIGESKEF